MKVTDLDTVSEEIRSHFEQKTAVREQALSRSRTLIQRCANTIRAIHRMEWDTVEERLAEIRESAAEFTALLADHPDIYHTGYSQDALKEYVEAHLTYALVRGELLPTIDSLNVIPSTYLSGLTEAATELRRHVLDMLRKGDHERAERALDSMDSIYSVLLTMEFSEAITNGLKRRTDTVRGVLERTRGDLTMSLRQQTLEEAIEALSDRLGLPKDGQEE